MALKLTGTMHNYAWGHPSLIAQLQGRAPSGRPEAEVWFGAHPSAPAGTPEGPLDAVIARDPEGALGQGVDTLPFLVKLLAAAKPLSLQAHPSLEQAREGFARENAAGIPLEASHRNYKDANHKPEVLIALTPFRAMAGFRPIPRTVELLRAFDLPELAPIERALDDPSLDAPLRLARALELAMASEASAAVAARAAQLNGSEVASNLVFIAREYPGDSGVVAAMLLNHVSLEPGQALFLSAGNLHAYLDGMGVEVMANSDNVLRGGLTEKHIDTAELFKVLRFDQLEDPTVPRDGGRYHVPVDDFAVAQVAGDTRVSGPAIVVNTAGVLTVGPVSLRAGEAAWVGHGEGVVAVTGDNAVGYAVTM